MNPEPPKEPNPYAPMSVVSREAESDRLAPRWLAIVASVLSYPLPGAGLLVLRRARRDLLWLFAGLIAWALFAVFRIALVGFALLVPLWIAGIVVTCVARRGPRPTGARIWVTALALMIAGKGLGFGSKMFLVEPFQIPA